MLITQTIIVYTLLTVLMCYCAYRSQGSAKTARLLGWMPILLFTLVFGLRYGVGIDYNNYLDIYDYTEDYSLSDLLEYERFEYGFSCILYWCHHYDAPVYIFFSILAFLQIFFIHKAFKDENGVLPYIYLTLILTGICMSSYMNIIRQIIAACIFLYSIRFIRDDKLLKYWMCCVLALTFHKSAILLFPLYFIWIRKKSLLNRPLIEFGMVFFSLILMYLTNWLGILHRFDNLIVLMGYDVYMDEADTMINGGGRSIGIFDFIVFAIYSMIILNSRQMKEYFKSDIFNILYDIFIVSICLGYIFKGSMLLGRLIVYFTNTQFIVVAYALSYLYHTHKQNNTQFFKYLFIVLFVVMQYSRFIYYCEQNTGAYVSYFQTELHDLKDNQRDAMMSSRGL